MVYENCPMNGKKDQTADWRLAEFVSYLSIWSVGPLLKTTKSLPNKPREWFPEN